MIFRQLMIIGSLVLFLFFGCSCPTDIDANRIVEPKEFAKVNFVHSAPDLEPIDVIYSTESAAENLAYGFGSGNYISFPISSQNIILQSYADKTVLFSGVTYLEKDSFYSMFIYGRDSDIDILTVEDKVDEISKDKAYYRFVHISPDYGDLVFKLFGESIQSSSLAYLSAGELQPANPGVFNIEIENEGSTILKTENFSIEQGRIYNFALQGYINGNGEKALQCQILHVILP